MSDIDQQTTQDDMPGEQAAELAAIHALAGEQVIPGAPVEEQEPEAEPLAVQIAGLLGMVVGLAGPVFPSLQMIYTPETIERVGLALAPVCDKHGWLQGGIGGKYKEELMAIAIVGPLAWATYAGVSQDIANRKPQQLEKTNDGPISPVAVDVASRDGDGNPGAVTVGKVIPHG